MSSRIVNAVASTSKRTLESFNHRPKWLATVRKHLALRNPHAAFKVFRQQLRQDSWENLEQTIRSFGRHSNPDSAQWAYRAFREYQRAGMSPSLRLMVRMLQVAPGQMAESQLLRVENADMWLDDEEAVVALMNFHGKLSSIETVESVFRAYSARLVSSGSSRQPGPFVWKALIDARYRAADLPGAVNWFHIWRSGPAHPYFSAATQVDRPKNPQRNWALQITSIRPPGIMSTPQFGKSRAAHTLSELPSPPAEPYLATLAAIVNLAKHNKSQHPASLAMLRLMAADRVKVTTAVYNAMMEHDLQRKEPTANRTILALYGQMLATQNPDCMPDITTFQRIFRSFRSTVKRAETSGQMLPSRPSKLAQLCQLDLFAPSVELSPRQILTNMMRTKTMTQDLSCDILNRALVALLRTNDLVGVHCVLDAFAAFRLVPNAKTHSLIVNHVLQYAVTGDAFTTSLGRDWLTSGQRTGLQDRVSNLSDIESNFRGDYRVVLAQSDSGYPMLQNSTSCDLSEPSQNALSTQNSIPERLSGPNRRTSAQRFCQDTEYLKEMLWYACPEPATYQEEVALARSDMNIKAPDQPPYRHQLPVLAEPSVNSLLLS